MSRFYFSRKFKKPISMYALFNEKIKSQEKHVDCCWDAEDRIERSRSCRLPRSRGQRVPVFQLCLLLPRHERSLDLPSPVSLWTFHLFSEFSVDHPPNYSSPKPPTSGSGHPWQCPLSLPLQIQFFANSLFLSSGHLYWIGRQEKFQDEELGMYSKLFSLLCKSETAALKKKKKGRCLLGKSVCKSFF